MFTESLLNTAMLLAAEGGAHHADPPLAFRVDTLIFSLLIFMGLAAILMKYAWKPIIEGLDKRESRISGEIENARLANEQAQKSLKEYEDKLAAVDGEAAAIVAEAKKDATTAKDKILAEAATEAQRTKDRALADIASAKNAAVQDLAQSSVDSAVSLAGSIVGRSLNKSDHSELIEKSVKQFGSGA